MNNLLMAIAVLAAVPPFEVQTLDGRSLVGSLAELTADRLVVETTDGAVSLELKTLLLAVNRQKADGAVEGPRCIVELVDGTVLRIRDYTAAASQATLTATDGKTFYVPLKAVSSVRFPGGSPHLAQQWAQLLQEKSQVDLLAVRNDESLDYHEGALYDVTTDTVNFQLDGELLPVKRAKVYGFAYRSGGKINLPAAVCRITDTTGSLWSARSLRLETTTPSEGRPAERDHRDADAAESNRLPNMLAWSTPAGLDVAQPLERIEKIDFSLGKVVYLSDLKPETVRWTPFFSNGKHLPAVEQFYAPRFDRGLHSPTLQLAGIQYRKGLALHSRTELVYRLPDRYSSFRTIAGIDNAIRPGGKVRLVVRSDQRQLFDVMISGADDPREIDLDLSDCRRLTIIVDFGDSMSMGGCLLLCNARLIK